MDDIKQDKSINLHKRVIISGSLLYMWHGQRMKGFRKVIEMISFSITSMVAGGWR